MAQDLTKMPKHVAIIMDGNGRWANARGMPRTVGHRRGLEALRVIVRHAGDKGVKFLTLFSFSSENWSRPPEEVSDLMALLRHFVRADLAEIDANNVRVRVIGNRDGLSPDIRGLLEEAEQTTENNDALQLVIAFNYGGRDDIVRAAKQIAEAVSRGEINSDQIDEALVDTALDTGDIPDPEVIIRTGGEQRISNFLLWQGAYSEFVFVDELWPDFDATSFNQALDTYFNRDRRFGGLSRKSA